MASPFSRRDLLEKCAAAGLLVVTPSLRGLELARLFQEGARAPRRATPGGDLGPFYRPNAPATKALAPRGAAGLPLGVSGRIFDTRGEALGDAIVEVWHASHGGLYDNEGFEYRGRIPVGGAGDYSFETVMPGHYPGRVAQHVHYRVSAPGHETLVTQLFFATDPAFGGNPDENYDRDPLVGSRELIRPVTIAGDPGTPRALVTFELVLDRA